jgi:gliding motility-associated-like protein
MKNLLLLSLWCLIGYQVLASSGCTGTQIPCSTASPFCTAITYDFSNSVGTCPPSGPSYGCLSSQPNPVWYYMDVDQSGTFQINISQTTGPNGTGSGLDVDFALYGPYSSVSAGCTSVMSGAAPIQCSYNIAPIETLGIGVFGGDPGAGGTTPPAAVAGQTYIVLITNYSGSSGFITFNQTGGTGVADCSIVAPTCQITSLTATPSNCSSNTYSVSGQIQFNDPPATGTLMVTNSCGGSQTFNAPFTSPLNYSLTGLTPTGGSCTITAAFSDDGACSLTQNYTSPAIPTVNAGTDQSVCTGNQVTLSGSGTSTYSWNGGVTNGVAFTPPAGLSTYTVTGTSAQGCTSTDQVNVTVNSNPTVSAGSYTPVCSSVPAVALAGTPAGGSFSGTGVSGTTFNTSAGTQTITYNYSDSNGCSGSATATITVNQNPVVDAGSDVSICEGGSIALNGAGTGTPVWSPASGLSSVGTLSTNASPSTTTTYTLTLTSNGCVGSDDVNVTVNPLPTANAGTDQAICIGDQVTLNGAGGSTMSWSNSIQDGVPFSTNSTTTYTLTVTDANGCTDQDQVLVTVNALPSIDAGSNQTICDGDAVTLSATGGVSYSWDNGIINGQSFVPVAGVTTYTVTGTDANGCENTDNVTITVNAYPSVNVLADTQVGYSALEVNFTDLSSGGDNYFWDFGNGQSGVVSVPTNQSMTYTSPGTYTMELTVSNSGCTISDTLMIMVMPFPAPIIHVPNVFTPNNDGSNDNFFIDVQYVTDLNMIIINRWGNTVHEINSIQGYWDGNINGNPADDGVYFFKYEVTGLNGDNLSGHGNVTLIRN